MVTEAGVPEGVTADIIGHEKQTMTYGLYSGGTSVRQRLEAMEAFENLMLKKKLKLTPCPLVETRTR